jgi:DME family drug/metabolite transporter
LRGELYAILCALCWALSSTLLKSQTSRVDAISLAAWRTVPGLCIALGLLFYNGRVNDVLHIPLRALLLLVGATSLGLGLGDLVYIRSMKLIGLSRAMPLSATYPFFTVVLAMLFLGEHLTWAMAGGALLITGGAYLLAFPQTPPRSSSFLGHGSVERHVDRRGVTLALAAALCWACATVLTRLGLEEVDAVVANSVRLSVVVVGLFAVLLGRGEVGRIREHGLRALGIVLLAGMIGTGLGTYAFLTALELGGAAKTSILTSTTPLFGVPLSLALGEKLTLRVLGGTTLAVVGVWLMV